MFDTFETHQSDLPLFEKLGLKPFKGNTGETLTVGTVKGNSGEVEIRVCGLPAQFWAFTVKCREDGRTTHLSTGSGVLEQYWPSINLFMENMLVCKSVRKTK